jgi:hypothetical protein
MKILYTCLIFSIIFSSKSYAQIPKCKDFILSSSLADNLNGKYNLGAEYFFYANSDSLNKSLLSLFVNAAFVKANFTNKNFKGFNVSTELNVYGQALQSKKWNEYAGLKLSYGYYKNLTDLENKNNYFVGFSTGTQPIIAKKIAIKLSTDIGYLRNGFTYNLIPDNRDKIFHSGFAMIFNLSVGYKF